MNKRPFAVFDIDGTLIRWQLYHALADELARRGLLDGKLYQQAREARLSWKQRTGLSAYHDYEEAMVRTIDAAIPTIPPKVFGEACASVIEVYKDQTYIYTRQLTQRLKAEGYLLFAISASQAEIVGLIAKYYAFDDFGGTHYVVKNGRFTGEKQVLMREKKPALLRRLAAKHQADYRGSLGIGDSESDILMLEEVEQAIAFNPSHVLFEHAKSRGWRIVLERKSVIYQLEPKDGHYSLA